MRARWHSRCRSRLRKIARATIRRASASEKVIAAIGATVIVGMATGRGAKRIAMIGRVILVHATVARVMTTAPATAARVTKIARGSLLRATVIGVMATDPMVQAAFPVAEVRQEACAVDLMDREDSTPALSG